MKFQGNPWNICNFLASTQPVTQMASFATQWLHLKQTQKAKNKDVFCNIGYIGFCKKLFLMIEDCLYILKMVSLWTLLHKTVVFCEQNAPTVKD